MTQQKRARIKADRLDSALGRFEKVEVSIGQVIDDEWDEPMGPTPMPDVTTLRSWDHKLLTRWSPSYMPLCQLCCLCTFGKCDLTAGKRGACGLNIREQSARIVLAACNIGCAAHLAHARHLVHHLIHEFGPRFPLTQGEGVDIEAPVSRLVTGIRPRTLEDASAVIDYCETQLTHTLSAVHTGQEGSWIDFESKAFHAGMIDQVGMEIADLVQIATMGFPQADPEAPLVQAGIASVDKSKAVILCIGHNVVPAAAITDYAEEHRLQDKIDVAGICCTAWDLTRHTSKAKVLGPISWQLRFVRSGIADVIVVDEQCIRTDILLHAQKVKAPLIATCDKSCMGLIDRTDDDVDAVVADLVSYKVPGVFIGDPEKAGEIVVKTALAVKPKRKGKSSLPSKRKIKELAEKCRQCYECVRACPNNYPIVDAVLAAQSGNLKPLAEIYSECVGCARCESACPNGFELHSWMTTAGKEQWTTESYMVRTGRGAIKDTEIRAVGQPVVFGEIPGVIAHVGCANYPDDGKAIHDMCEEFANRRFIILLSGCAAMTVGTVKDKEGKSIYERRSGAFEAGGVVNVGSCVSNPHIAGAAIKIASIFAKRNLRGNYEEIADYITNRVGAVGISWGAMSQKAASIASGFWRLGVPVIVGPHGTKYRRMLLGRADKAEDWMVYNARTGEQVQIAPGPEHLFYAVETMEECMVMTAKLCFRPNDTSKGRAIKLSHYIDLHERYYGFFPDDVHRYIRTKTDIPITLKKKIEAQMKEHKWKERPIPDPTLLKRMVYGGGK